MSEHHSNKHWWLGVADLLAHGVQHGAVKLQRVHLAVADESFRLLEAVPLTRPGARVVRLCHHEISRVSYGSVALAGRLATHVTGRAPEGERGGNVNNS